MFIYKHSEWGFAKLILFYSAFFTKKKRDKSSFRFQNGAVYLCFKKLADFVTMCWFSMIENSIFPPYNYPHIIEMQNFNILEHAFDKLVCTKLRHVHFQMLYFNTNIQKNPASFAWIFTKQNVIDHFCFSLTMYLNVEDF